MWLLLGVERWKGARRGNTFRGKMQNRCEVGGMSVFIEFLLGRGEEIEGVSEFLLRRGWGGGGKLGMCL